MEEDVEEKEGESNMSKKKDNLIDKVINVIDEAIETLDKKEEAKREKNIQTKFNTDGLNELVAEGSVENVYNENN